MRARAVASGSKPGKQATATLPLCAAAAATAAAPEPAVSSGALPPRSAASSHRQEPWRRLCLVSRDIEQLRVDLPAPRIDRDRQLRIRRACSRRAGACFKGRQRVGDNARHHRKARDADGRDAGREREPAGRRDTDARARERAGPDGDGDAVEVVKPHARARHDLIDHGHQALRMTRRETLARTREHIAVAAPRRRSRRQRSCRMRE